MSNEASTPQAEVLSSSECWKLLRSVSVGRLAVWVNDHPDIFPLNYKVDHGTLVFRTGAGTKLSASLAGPPVALEADGVKDRKSTRLNSSHMSISYAVFCLKKKKKYNEVEEIIEVTKKKKNKMQDKTIRNNIDKLKKEDLTTYITQFVIR